MPYEALAKPFVLSLWLAVAALALVAAVVLVAVQRCEGALAPFKPGRVGVVAEALLVVVGVLCQQGTGNPIL